ncbi:uncharacterized protein F5147DRAFT_656473 [Suillus discolor]|uniref:Uncharacterized protein n=1 Tax=Suillus discolor TaxID=1912936 RepID=A0A9P7EZE0_9AGAM|nr:uncharacterized protein F5147DRAFT_656473 [Suillus discolor]KAG2097024.1 hypothetical protein F5147DRAFT_656473 [Suillus discolor]
MIAAKKAKKGNGVVAAIDVEENHTIAVVMPSTALGNGTDSEECVAPLQTPHLHWDCLVTGPAVSSPVQISTLIDHGSSLVLIDEDFTWKLSLWLRTLSTPLPVTLALSPKQKQSFRLSHYDTNYDLLRPQPPTAPANKTASWGPELFWAKKNVVRELNKVLPELKAIMDDKCETVWEFDVIGVINAQIDSLHQQTLLAAKDKAMKDEFRHRFPVDIPHNDSLPCNVLFRVQLKDTNQIVQKCSYDCPKKYHAAWKVLLDSHVESGCLKHLESEFSSLAFIIPKADPTVLPQWVNNFQLLNLNTVPDNHPLPRIDEILKDCVKGKFFGKIDMTNAFFQTQQYTCLGENMSGP